MSRYNLNAARRKEQLRRMISLEERKICAFCPENIAKETTSPIQYETKHWMVKDNDFPYENTKIHILIISKKHVKSISELPKPARAEFLDVVSWIEKKYKLKSYAVGFRSGDFRFNGGSVEHLHAQVIVGDVSQPNYTPVRFKMSSQGK
jgi:ATP adenylyltransferase